MLHTLRVLAVEAALGLHDGHVSRVTQAHLVEVMGTYLGILFRDGDPVFLVEGLFRDAADMALMAFRFLFRLKLFARHHVVVHGLAFHGLVEIHILTQELGAVDAGELGLSGDAHTAGAAHARAIDHDAVQRDGASDAQFLAGLGDELHHDHRSDGDGLVIDLAAGHQLTQYIRHQSLAARRAVV